MTSLFARLSSLFLLLTLTACASVSVTIPSARVEPPDVPGVTRVNFGANLIPGREINFTNDASARPPNISGGLENSGGTLLAGDVGMGLGRRFEIGVNAGGAHWQSGCIGAMGKFQISGDSNATAKAGDVPIAIFAHTEGCATSEHGDQNGDFGAGGYPWHGDSQSAMGDVGFSAGYRPTDYMMIYAGGSYGVARATVSIRQGAANSSPAADHSDFRNGNEANASIGLKFKWRRIWFHVQGAYSHVTFGGADPDSLAGEANFTFQI